MRVVDVARFDPLGTRTPGVLERDGIPELTTAEAGAERYLEKISERSAAPGAVVTHEVRSSWIVDEVLRLLRPSDLLVFAAHDRDRLERAILGSVATSLLERSPVPVVFIRPQAS